MKDRHPIEVGITKATDHVAGVLARVMPWLFLILRQALIPTVGWVIVAVSFLAVPQTREVLHGLGEPPLKSALEVSNSTLAVNAWGLAWYAIASVLVAFSVWYSARLLCTVDATNSTPRGLSDKDGERRLAVAREWVPRIVGVSLLALNVCALIYSNLGPLLRLSALAELAISALPILGPLLVAIAYVRSPTLSPRATKAFAAFGMLLTVVSAIILFNYMPNPSITAWSFGCALLPAMLLVFLVKRVSLLQRWGFDAGPTPTTHREFGAMLASIGWMLVLGLAVLLAMAATPPGWMQPVGAAATVLVFLAATMVALTGAQLLLRRASKDVPGLTSLVCLVIIAAIALVGDESLGTEMLRSKGKLSHSPVTGKFAHIDELLVKDVYVNAHGGGLRAAVFTAEILAQTDDATCGKFGARIAALSGASGGSLGIATYLIARQELVARKEDPWRAYCAEADIDSPGPVTRIVRHALVQDHLAPVIARTLTYDTTYGLWSGKPARGQALLESWQRSLLGALSQAFDLDEAAFPGLALPLSHLSGGVGTWTAVHFNATDADSGHIVWFGNDNGGFSQRIILEKSSATGQMSVGEAVLHSARFPFISPAGKYEFSPTDAIRLVDGGYADNSAADSLHDIYAMHRDLVNRADKFRYEPKHVNIDGNYPIGNCAGELLQGPRFTAIIALMQSRTARAEAAVRKLAGNFANPIPMTLDVEVEYDRSSEDLCKRAAQAQRAPLGWYMSYGAARSVAKFARSRVREMCIEYALDCKAENLVVFGE